jgi:hypothetical protein
MAEHLPDLCVKCNTNSYPKGTDYTDKIARSHWYLKTDENGTVIGRICPTCANEKVLKKERSIPVRSYIKKGGQ